jgi:hypothetical protein
VTGEGKNGFPNLLHESLRESLSFFSEKMKKSSDDFQQKSCQALKSFFKGALDCSEKECADRSKNFFERLDLRMDSLQGVHPSGRKIRDVDFFGKFQLALGR